ncbi:MAG: DUF6282 family protein [Candidatus Solibacter sp.]
MHSAPDVDPRRFNDLELVVEAARAGVAAVLIKSHQNSTVERAWLVEKVVPGIRVFGGLVLNRTVGGVNPHAVKLALRLGAWQIWTPTRSAANHRRHHQQEGGITVLHPDGGLLPEVREVVRLVADSACILSTGHLAPEEGVALLQYAARAGVTRLVVTHHEWPAHFYPVDIQRDLAALGVFFERCFVSMTHRCGCLPIGVIAGAISEVGFESSVARQ